jgi:hypothetical protein
MGIKYVLHVAELDEANQTGGEVTVTEVYKVQFDEVSHNGAEALAASGVNTVGNPVSVPDANDTLAGVSPTLTVKSRRAVRSTESQDCYLVTVVYSNMVASEDSFVVRTRGTVLIGPRASEVDAVVSVGDALDVVLDGKTIRTQVAGIETFHISPPQDDPPVGILLADDIGKVPSGTTVRPAR